LKSHLLRQTTISSCSRLEIHSLALRACICGWSPPSLTTLPRGGT
jgi:hypothetical protein